jgi:hypothetical protein
MTEPARLPYAPESGSMTQQVSGLSIRPAPGAPSQDPKGGSTQPQKAGRGERTRTNAPAANPPPVSRREHSTGQATGEREALSLASLKVASGHATRRPTTLPTSSHTTPLHLLQTAKGGSALSNGHASIPRITPSTKPSDTLKARQTGSSPTSHPGPSRNSTGGSPASRKRTSRASNSRITTPSQNSPASLATRQAAGALIVGLDAASSAGAGPSTGYTQQGQAGGSGVKRKEALSTEGQATVAASSNTGPQRRMKICIETGFWISPKGGERLRQSAVAIASTLALRHNAAVPGEHPRMLPARLLRPDETRPSKTWCLVESSDLESQGSNGDFGKPFLSQAMTNIRKLGHS